ncbi:alpha/beta fold hydrolase [Neiella marina]|uniref:Alpha/beta fold hydrolase n=1 Tax=Neiella holothuriorum TaxID=2870530 RepID=A0ABS7EKG3_9GAMM|nr:alpha/beta fold hydrolase [Neiella holothuriorum]MBW8192266.1 alpha/beta fold hydrolase [Neiella holothuriorum]
MSKLPQLAETDSLRQLKITDFCQRHEQQHVMTGTRGRRLHYCFYPQPKQPLLVIAPGRAEAAFKYRELAMDCFNQGYQVSVIDHRGQGLSQRFFPERHLGHMDSFDHAAQDLLQLTRRCNFDDQPCYLIAHSMGASIALRAMQLAPNQFHRAALSAPMLGLPLPYPAVFLKPYLAVRSAIEARRWRKQKQCPDYISSSRRDYHDSGFEQNPLTSSTVRYHEFRAMYQQQPELQLGGPTAGWLYQAMRLIESIQHNTDKLVTPMLFALAEDERVVAPAGQQKLRRNLLQKPVESYWLNLPKARHEPLLEVDSIRTPLLQQIFTFFKRA